MVSDMVKDEEPLLYAEAFSTWIPHVSPCLEP
jgi:hypothetical protein